VLSFSHTDSFIPHRPIRFYWCVFITVFLISIFNALSVTKIAGVYNLLIIFWTRITQKKMNKMIKGQCLYHFIHLFQRNLVQKMVSDNLNSGHFGYTLMLFLRQHAYEQFDQDEYKSISWIRFECAKLTPNIRPDIYFFLGEMGAYLN